MIPLLYRLSYSATDPTHVTLRSALVKRSARISGLSSPMIADHRRSLDPSAAHDAGSLIHHRGLAGCNAGLRLIEGDARLAIGEGTDGGIDRRLAGSVLDLNAQTLVAVTGQSGRTRQGQLVSWMVISRQSEAWRGPTIRRWVSGSRRTT